MKRMKTEKREMLKKRMLSVAMTAMLLLGVGQSIVAQQPSSGNATERANSSGAMGQLNRATNGTQSNGTTFDNRNDRIVPGPGASVPSVPQPVAVSSGTAGGYSVNSSTGTSKGNSGQKTKP